MNEQAVPNEAGGYLFELGGKRPLGRTALQVAGLGAVISGVAIAFVANPSGYFAIPLAIAIVVLGVLLLMAYALGNTSQRRKKRSTPAHAKASADDSVASNLALLADLYSRGALSPEEFVAAKRRVLGF